MPSQLEIQNQNVECRIYLEPDRDSKSESRMRNVVSRANFTQLLFQYITEHANLHVSLYLIQIAQEYFIQRKHFRRSNKLILKRLTLSIQARSLGDIV